jgi:hypothetical protein
LLCFGCCYQREFIQSWCKWHSLHTTDR